MSRIGIQPVEVPDSVDIEWDGERLTVKGKHGEVTRRIHPEMDLEIQDGEITVHRNSDHQDYRSLHGMTRSLIASMVEGVEKKYEKRLEMSGVGYRARMQGRTIVLEVGYSHPVEIEAEEGIEIEVEENTEITVRGADKQQVGEVAARIREVRPPEPYKGKGIKYEDEHIRRKEGKTGAGGLEE